MVTWGGVGWLRQGYPLLVAVKLVSCIQLFQVGLTERCHAKFLEGHLKDFVKEAARFVLANQEA